MDKDILSAYQLVATQLRLITKNIVLKPPQPKSVIEQEIFALVRDPVLLSEAFQPSDFTVAGSKHLFVTGPTILTL